MKRATTNSIQEFTQTYVLKDSFGSFIPNSETGRFMTELMAEYSGIYCGTAEDKQYGRKLIVKS